VAPGLTSRQAAIHRPCASAKGIVAPSGASSAAKNRLSIPGRSTRLTSGRSLSGAECNDSSKNGKLTR